VLVARRQGDQTIAAVFIEVVVVVIKILYIVSTAATVGYRRGLDYEPLDVGTLLRIGPVCVKAGN
jgi:hypothetical protein